MREHFGTGINNNKGLGDYKHMDKYHDRRRLIGPSAAWMAVAMAVERVGNMVRGRP